MCVSLEERLARQGVQCHDAARTRLPLTNVIRLPELNGGNGRCRRAMAFATGRYVLRYTDRTAIMRRECRSCSTSAIRLSDLPNCIRSASQWP